MVIKMPAHLTNTRKGDIQESDLDWYQALRNLPMEYLFIETSAHLYRRLRESVGMQKEAKTSTTPLSTYCTR